MAPQGKLVEVGRVGFDILEWHMGKKEKLPSQSYRPVMMTQSKKNKAVIDGNQVVKAYDRALIVGYCSQLKMTRWAF